MFQAQIRADFCSLRNFNRLTTEGAIFPRDDPSTGEWLLVLLLLLPQLPRGRRHAVPGSGSASEVSSEDRAQVPGSGSTSEVSSEDRAQARAAAPTRTRRIRLSRP